MNEFQFAAKTPHTNENDRKIIINFLSSIDSEALSDEILNTMSWGDGDPIVIAINKLVEMASSW
jgi:hypothetical protein